MWLYVRFGVFCRFCSEMVQGRAGRKKRGFLSTRRSNRWVAHKGIILNTKSYHTLLYPRSFSVGTPPFSAVKTDRRRNAGQGFVPCGVGISFYTSRQCHLKAEPSDFRRHLL
ncbi:hypothetical protein EPM78_03560 [Neisseria gonorrhoeae]|uniref:Uncharacterized protein n=2 Tax=Neisseria gonorrhoeae TaxID=485 RepID=Q5F530_NEIG1|nr:hypothetical protein NGO_2106 [Neisseria gonorrhoeae FA 1090]ANJ48919.1 hypothetical protein ASO12_11650 [Neisseria gonorrhoeae]EEH61220.1 predicted protein [Neisseria gonorrhoeae 1291]EEZ42714.1 conserved hypothetical protein [Neisseria gonorrhoeae 35/02]EEZ49232.1 predicted protein [Neisseria gonorrhoeae PID18]EEZ51464.1 predicted protein [Neisseria gonorrhoeae PID1]EEZ53890.1 predicted protein [Neisseria gonorrhoeae PID332]EEZ56061.1 predicted protein [Neisseria gonorrhoeae SK-92-679]